MVDSRLVVCTVILEHLKEDALETVLEVPVIYMFSK